MWVTRRPQGGLAWHGGICNAILAWLVSRTSAARCGCCALHSALRAWPSADLLSWEHRPTAPTALQPAPSERDPAAAQSNGRPGESWRRRRRAGPGPRPGPGPRRHFYAARFWRWVCVNAFANPSSALKSPGDGVPASQPHNVHTAHSVLPCATDHHTLHAQGARAPHLRMRRRTRTLSLCPHAGADGGGAGAEVVGAGGAAGAGSSGSARTAIPLTRARARPLPRRWGCWVTWTTRR